MKAKDIVQILLAEFAQKLDRLDDLVQREEQFPKASNKIKVAIGMRRVGKTYFLYQQILKLLKEGVAISRILYINFEDDRLFPMDSKGLAELIEAFYALYPENHDQHCYLFLDEIQNIQDWSLVVRRFQDSLNAEIFLTGSSAKLLSKEIASSLRGRSLSSEIWPYSFYEFLKAKNIKTILLSGDNKIKCEQVANEVGIDEIYAEQSPEEKLVKIAALNNELPTAMVGDGINDAPSLETADIGISFGDATSVAMNAADVVIIGQSELKSVITAIEKIGRAHV